jgi:hypothetical protein
MAGINFDLGLRAPGGYAKPQPASPPNWNANDGAFKDLYPGVETLGEGMWGWKDPTEVSRLNQEWFSDQKKQAKPQHVAGFAFDAGFGNKTARGSGFNSGWAGSANDLGVKG